MFRQHPQKTQSNLVDPNEISRKVDDVHLVADAILYFFKDNKGVKAAVNNLLYTVDQFDEHRAEDLINNSTARAEQVLNARRIYRDLYKSELKKSARPLAAKALKEVTDDYAEIVKETLRLIQADLAAQLNNQYQADLFRHELDVLFNELEKENRQIRDEAAAAELMQIDASCDSEFSETEEYNVISDEEILSDTEDLLFDWSESEDAAPSAPKLSRVASMGNHGLFGNFRLSNNSEEELESSQRLSISI